MTEKDFDKQLREAFQGLQSQILEGREKQKNADVTKAAMKQNIRVAEIVKSQLEQLPKNEDRAVYRIVGRAFFQESSASEIIRQDSDIKLCNERIILMDKQKDYLAKNIAESEKNLRELIQNRR